MVISVYLLKETREKSVTFDEGAVPTSSREDLGSLRAGGGVGSSVGGSSSSFGPRPDWILISQRMGN